ncbi:MAG: hypothetical protein ACMUJM_24510 [bacterium]
MTNILRGCSHSFMFKLPYLLAPPIAPTADILSCIRAVGTFTPRNERVITLHELWYRYVSESGN